MNKFELTSAYQPTGDQPEAIAQLTEGVHEGLPAQTLLGVTGSGKTFTIANVIANINKPTLILSHNKTLAAQLYSEFKGFFPNNAVEYYVSYYDYYQPEAYLPSSDTYIEKDLAINDEIDKLRLAATSALLSGRKDVVVVSSVSCIYGMGNPADFYNNVIEVQQGKNFSRNVFLRRLVDSLYVRNDIDLNRGNFRVKGDTVDIYLAYADNLLRVTFWGDEVDSIEEVDPMSGVTVAKFDAYKIYPANLFMTTKEATLRAIHEIEDDLHKQVQWFENEGRPFEAKRLQERVTYDMEMIRELGHCSGIENYSRYFDGRAAGTRPYCLLDFFPEDFLIVIDESHVSVPQIRAMYGGDRARKINLVEYGFRLPAAMDNRPLKFDEFEEMAKQVIYVSATPADYELMKSEGIVVEQVIRPTGLLDPIIEVRPSHNQIDDLMEEIQVRIEKNERTLVTTLTKRMAERHGHHVCRQDNGQHATDHRRDQPPSREAVEVQRRARHHTTANQESQEPQCVCHQRGFRRSRPQQREVHFQHSPPLCGTRKYIYDGCRPYSTVHEPQATGKEYRTYQEAYAGGCQETRFYRSRTVSGRGVEDGGIAERKRRVRDFTSFSQTILPSFCYSMKQSINS